MSDQHDPRAEEQEHREAVKGVAGCPVMDPAELLAVGYVAEANRTFFHPLGLALAVDPTSGRVTVLDDRADPEGWIFRGEEGDALHDELIEKRDRIRAIVEERRPARVAALGFWVQPLDGVDLEGRDAALEVAASILAKAEGLPLSDEEREQVEACHRLARQVSR